MTTSCKIVGKSVIKVRNLEPNQVYKILCTKRVKTKYGDAILCELEENVTFLPKRFSEKIDNAKLGQMNRAPYGIINIGCVNSGAANSTTNLECINL